MNQQCISDVSRNCANRISGLNGEPANVLQEYTSNCLSFKFFMENVLTPQVFGEIAETLNQRFLDTLKQQWCGQESNYTNPECLCLSVFNRNQQFQNQCRLNITSCSAFPQDPSECYGRFFSKQNNGDSWQDQTFGPGIKFMNISFDRCQPYYCWADVCWDADVYKTYAAMQSQTTGCGNVCISVKGENTMTINDPSNVSFQNIRPATTTMPVCDQSDETILLFYYPEFYRNRVDNFTFIPVSIGNQSNGRSAFMKLESSQSNNSQGLFWFTPPQTFQFIEVPGNQQTTLYFSVNTAQLLQLYSLKTPIANPLQGQVGEVYVCNQDLNVGDNSCGLLTPDEFILSPTYKYSYQQTIQDPNGNFVNNTAFVTVYANMILLSPDLTPTAPTQKLTPQDNPTWIRWLFIVCLLLFIVTYIGKTLANTYAVRIYPLIKQSIQNLPESL